MENRNLILAIVLSMLVLLVWNVVFMEPERQRLEALRAMEAVQATESGDTAHDLSMLANANTEQLPVTREAALALAPGRVPIESASLIGSLNLQGVRIDDLSLKNYRENLSKDSPLVTILTPGQMAEGHYMQTGIIAGDATGQSAVWQAPPGARLTPETPVNLTREEGGLAFTMTIRLDENYLFEVTQSVTNNTSDTVNLMPYGITYQRDVPSDLRNFMILHEGPIGVIGGILKQRGYKKILKKGAITQTGTGGWVGLTKKNWLTALIPPQTAEFTGKFSNASQVTPPLFEARYALTPAALAAGQTYEVTSHMFAGAKRVATLKAYEAAPEDGGIGVVDFDKAVDWGNFFFLTRPIFYMLHFFAELTGNYGIAILLLTLVIKALLFPLANKSFESMAQMKKMQPQITALRDRYKDDKVKQQQEMMAIYKKEKINPAAGCLPILLQMPIFYALYKTLFVTIETRHEGFLYIRDLSAQDPTNIFNLFGLLPFDPTAIPMVGPFLAIGILPLLMGASMWVQTKLNPPAGDKTQQQIMALMPFFFVFIFAPFAAGLVLYWFWNTFLGVVQQYIIMKRNGADVALFDNLKGTLKGLQRKTPKANNDNKS